MALTRSDSSLNCFLNILPAVSGPIPLPAITKAALSPWDLAKEADLANFLLLTTRLISIGCSNATIRLLQLGQTNSFFVIAFTFLLRALSQERHLSDKSVRSKRLLTAVTTELSDFGGLR